MFKRNLTGRDFLRIRSSEILNGALALSDAERYAQAEFAKTVRNFWFTASAYPISSGAGVTVKIEATTPRLAEPVIITDILALFDYKVDDPAVSAMVSRQLLELVRYGGEEASSGANLFGLTGLVGAEFITHHEKNRSQGVGFSSAPATLFFDTQDKHLPFVPRLLRPYDFIQARWRYNTNLGRTKEDAWMLQLGFRAVRVLPTDSPYRYIANSPAAQIKNYISAMSPETFLLEVRFPFANIHAVNTTPLVVKTPQMGRPLLILGATSNLEGVQADLFDEDDYYRFTYLDRRPFPDEAPTTAIPLNVWAPDTDFRNTNMFNMWPVPHLLEPGSQLRIEITNGLIPTPTVPEVFQQVAKTRSSQDARITFICRTV